jgi:elongation factor P hydroxylase
MKLYTEEQVIKMINKCQATGLHSDYLLEGHTPIELPSDEEIEESAVKIYGDFGGCSVSVERGAKWMRDKIQGQ